MHMAGVSYQITTSSYISHFERETIKPVMSEEVSAAGWRVYRLSADAFPKIADDARRMARQIHHFPRFNNIFLLGLVSQFDSYLGDLVRCLAVVMPHIINDSGKQYSAVELLEFGSLEEFKLSIVEREVESVLRTSHEDQFKWLESKIKKPLRDGLHNWPDFIEIFERRNLFAHTNGIVTRTYLAKCQSVGYKTDAGVGEILSADPDYLRDSARTLMEVGVKLSQVLWRVSCNDAENHEEADKLLNNSAFELIKVGMYSSAISILDFAFLPAMKHPRKAILNMMRINLANAHKLSGDIAAAERALSEEDWSPMQEQFQLCVAAVRDDFEEVRRLVPLVPADQISAANYFQWPVFRGLVKRNDYIQFIRERFGDEIVEIYGGSRDDASLSEGN